MYINPSYQKKRLLRFMKAYLPEGYFLEVYSIYLRGIFLREVEQ